MKKKQNWMKEFSVEKDGFYGHFYQPKEDVFPKKALIVLGGGGVPYQSTLDMAEAFAGLGIQALAVGYFGVPGTPKTIIRVPIEYVEASAKYLHEKGASVVIATGISKGGELALVAASRLPSINAVIAFSPSSRVNMGIGNGISWANASSWSYQKKELPYAYARYSGLTAIWHSLCARELTFLQAYQKAHAQSGEESIIPVEQIKGPVLVVGAASDSLWPSAEPCHEIIKRLEDHRFSYPYKELVYPYACHLLLPFETSYLKLFRIGRKHPKECQATVRELRKEIINWLKAC